MAVKAGFRGSLTLNIAGGGAVAYGVRQASHRESIQQHDTSSTASTLVSNVLQSTAVLGKTQGVLSVQAQYSAGGAGDPPAFAAGALYNNIPVVFTGGDTVSGNYQVREYENSFNVDGTIDYDLVMTSNGAITRANGS